MLELQKFRINLIELVFPLCAIRPKETADASDERERSSSTTRVVQPLNAQRVWMRWSRRAFAARERSTKASNYFCGSRSEEHTSELQSLTNLVCRLLLEK